MRYLTVAMGFALVLSGMSVSTASASGSQVEASDDAAFQAWLSKLVDVVQGDKRYVRIPLDTPGELAEFSEMLHRVYVGAMSDIAFMEWVDQRYPGHRYEQLTILKSLYQERRGSGAN